MSRVYPNDYNPPHFRNTNVWEPLPATEITRLTKTLHAHLKKMGISMKPADREKFVQELLDKQNHTCALGKDVEGRYCWNEPKENWNTTEYRPKVYLKLQWGHKKPLCRRTDQSPSELYLLCARCNNHIQSSRTIDQLADELRSKLEAIKSLCKSV